MPGVEQPSPSKQWYQEDSTRIILATFVTLAVAAGSTIWRRSHSQMAVSSASQTPSPEPQEIVKTILEPEAGDAGEQAAASKAAKNARSKERRRRGKDPVKLLATGVAGTTTKKEKGKKKGPQGGPASVVIPQIIEPPTPSQDETRSQSTASRSTSRSSSLCASRNPSLLDAVESDEHEPDNTDDVHTPLVASLESSQSEPAMYDAPCQEQALSVSQSDPSFVINAPTPALLSSASSSSSSTMPVTPKSEYAHPLPQTLQPSISMYPHYTPSSPSRSPNRRMSPAPNGAWDYDNHVAADPATTYRKPPRFRSKSRGSAESGLGTMLEMPLPLQSSVSEYSPAPYGGLPPLVPSESAPSIESAGAEPTEILPTFTFPSLNNPSPASEPELRPAPTSPSRPSSRPGSAAAMRPRMGPNGNMHRASSSSMANSPLRTPTPSQAHPPSPFASSFTSPSSSTSVSAQTQLASLRGALEAARLREEKAKQDVERLHRECADLRWRWSEDAGRWSRREMELQNYIQMLTRQLHVYASATAPDQQLQMTSPAVYPNGAVLPGIPSAIPASVYAASSSHSQPSSPGPISERHLHSQSSSQPSTQPQSPASHSHPGSPLVPGSILGPLSPFTQQNFPASQFPSMQRGAELPFQPPHPGQGYTNHNNVFSLFFPGPNGTAGSGYSSPSASPIIGAGRGIEGDASPLGDRGRRRGRTRTHTATHMDRHDAEGSGSGSGNSNVSRDVFKGDDEEEEEFNNVLADAILKRPESIRNGSFGSLRRKTSGNDARKEVVSLNDEHAAAALLSSAADQAKEEDGWIRPPDSRTTPSPVGAS
ncbi:hypothetical protein HWV62_42731 [Athelia sp. TMB]|nr:hypothetical protein HWV62_42731 [Athelia sp. TMB]